MSINLYLAMTAAEFSSKGKFHSEIAWMACHFSCYGTGLTNLPTALPKGSMVIVNDRTPPWGHDAQKILWQLSDLAHQFSVSRFLLDFQRPGDPETKAIVKALVQSLPCPTAVSDIYAKDLPCPVFLPPGPLHKPLQEYISAWEGREIWLEAATGQETSLTDGQVLAGPDLILTYVYTDGGILTDLSTQTAHQLAGMNAGRHGGKLCFQLL